MARLSSSPRFSCWPASTCWPSVCWARCRCVTTMSPAAALPTRWTGCCAHRTARSTPFQSSRAGWFRAPPALLERLLVHHVRHPGDVPAVVAFQHVNQTLHRLPGHAFSRIRREARDLGGAGEVRQQAAAVFDCRVAQGRICGEWFFFVDVESGARNPVFLESPGESGFVHDRAARRVHQERGRLHLLERGLIEEMIGGGVGFTRAQQGHVDADKVRLGNRLLEAHVPDPSLFTADAAIVAEVLYLLNGFDEILIL